MSDNTYKVSNDCRITKGYSNTTLVDFSRSNIYSISNSIVDLIVEYEYKSIDLLLEATPKSLKHIIHELIDLEILITFHKIIPFNKGSNKTFCKEKSITHCIFDFDELMYDYESFMYEIAAKGMIHLQIRVFNPDFRYTQRYSPRLS